MVREITVRRVAGFLRMRGYPEMADRFEEDPLSRPELTVFAGNLLAKTCGPGWASEWMEEVQTTWPQAV